VNARLRAVETLSKAGIFVRIMAMPFMTFSSTEEQTHQDMTTLKELCFDHGAIAFKNKGLNYFNAEDVRSGQARKVKSQENKYFDDLIIKSGEVVFSKNKC